MKTLKLVKKTSGIRKATLLSFMLCSAILVSGTAWALGTTDPSDASIMTERAAERATLVIDTPDPGTEYEPVGRVPRQNFGVVDQFPYGIGSLDALVYPGTSDADKLAIEEGVLFFTTPHTFEEGAGPAANQQMCLGCHMSSIESIKDKNIVGKNCKKNSVCASIVSRGSRATPTNFRYTAYDPATGGGRAPDFLDAVTNAGRTAAFTVYGDFQPGGLGIFDPLDGVFNNPVTGTSQQFGGFVQHVRPSISECLPDIVPDVHKDHNLYDLDTGLATNNGFRRTLGERAAPPYIGRGLIEAVPNEDITGADDEDDVIGYRSSLATFSTFNCNKDCIVGHHNEIPSPVSPGITNFIGGVGRFGLRANGAEIIQFVAGGLQGELGFTSLLNPREINVLEDTGCGVATPAPSDPVEATLNIPFRERNYIRNVAPPEFGNNLLGLLYLDDPTVDLTLKTSPKKVIINEKTVKLDVKQAAMVQRGAQLFGIDLIAFKNRMVGFGEPGTAMQAGADDRDDHAINTQDIMLGCASCHTPIQRTGQAPYTEPVPGVTVGTVGADKRSYKWAPIFSDLILHKVPTIDAERFATTSRNPVIFKRPSLAAYLKNAGTLPSNFGKALNSFDISRNLTDDAFSNQKATADGRDFRTAPLMGMGRMGPPYMHDARVYLSIDTYKTFPASTVTTNNEITNAPLVVQSVDDAIRAAIEVHDLPAPDDGNTPGNILGAGCPVPAGNAVYNVYYGANAADVICPPYDSELTDDHRSEAREVIRRYRNLSPADQNALIAFLKEL